MKFVSKSFLVAGIAVVAASTAWSADSSTIVAQWCSQVSGALTMALASADNAVALNQLDSAKQQLEAALNTADASLAKSQVQVAPVTKQLLDRGVALSQAIDGVTGAGDPLSALTEVSFLDDYLRFVVSTEQELDVPFYLPYVYQYGQCVTCPGSFDVVSFERQYLAYAQAQLSFVGDHLTEVVNGAVYPIGDPRVFLKAAELVSGWVAQDLGQSLFAAQEACTAGQLSTLSTSLAAYNSGTGGTMFMNLPQAVAQTRAQLDGLSDAITSTSCGF
jgi:hypothetical protein